MLCNVSSGKWKEVFENWKCLMKACCRVAEISRLQSSCVGTNTRTGLCLIPESHQWPYGNNRKGKWYQVTLDVGKLDGVYSGLGFYFPKKNDRICRLIISNVYDKTCVGLIKYINDLHSKECIECKSYSTKNIKSWIIPEK